MMNGLLQASLCDLAVSVYLSGKVFISGTWKWSLRPLAHAGLHPWPELYLASCYSQLYSILVPLLDLYIVDCNINAVYFIGI